MHVLDYWRARQKNNAEEFQKRYSFGISALYNLARNATFEKRNPLRKIIQSDFDLFTNHFPVLLVNPTICSSLLPMKEGLFDIVIFDEASQLRIEDVYAAKLRGKYKVVAGDENQMPPSSFFAALPGQNTQNEIYSEEEESDLESLGTDLADSESLLEFAKRKGYEDSYLDIHYRSRHPDLIEFSNAAFYGDRLKPLPAGMDYKSIRYFNVNGVYNQDEGVNLKEAERVIEIINDEVKLNKEIPSIGIATLNLLQRNLILNMINKKSDENPEFAQKIFKLKEKAGESFFVKNLENIQGDERDIIIISTTFGLKEDGSFIQNYGPVNQQKGYRLLNVIITRAKHKIYVCTSIPENYIAEYSNILGNDNRSGRGLFYAYLAYAKSIEENDVSKKENILKLLITNNGAVRSNNEQGFVESVFEQEVFDLLSEKIEKERIVLQYKLGGFRIDIAVLSKTTGKPVVAIECDGANYHLSAEAYAWDLFRQRFLENYGLKFIRIWSVNWWNSPESEMERLMEFIKLNDN
jgi:very-short-patch-repair endonuclease